MKQAPLSFAVKLQGDVSPRQSLGHAFNGGLGYAAVTLLPRYLLFPALPGDTQARGTISCVPLPPRQQEETVSNQVGLGMGHLGLFQAP